MSIAASPFLPAGVSLRPAVPADLDALQVLEASTFRSDVISRRSFRRLLASSAAHTVVAEAEGRIAGYAMVLLRAGSLVARLYSIAVGRAFAGRGIGKALLAATEEAARARACLVLRLEVDERNAAAQRLYERAGYRRFGRRLDYYDDGGTALRLEKRLVPTLLPPGETPPYFHQTTDFTCGPACMMMALAWAGRSLQAGAALEVRLWREATTIFMASGPGGCEPFGIAVTLKRHGLSPEIFVSRPGPYFVDGVRSDTKRRVMQVAQAEFSREAEALGIPVHLTPLAESALMHAFDSGAAAIVLVSGYRMLRRHVPHWVFAYGHAGRHVFVHDPAAEDGEDGEPPSAQSFAIPWPAFQRLSRFGAEELRAAILIRKGPPQ